MLGLIKKDLIIMVKRMNPMQLLILFVVVIPISQFPQYTLISISLVISYMASILVSTSFTYDAASKWDEYAIALPFSAKQIVKAKYMLVLILMVIAFALMGITFLFCLMAGLSNLDDLKLALLASLLFAVTYNAIQIPLIYKFGVEIGKYSLFVMLLIPYMVMGIVQIFKINFNILYFRQGIGFIILLFGQFFLLILSFYVSVRIYSDSRKK